MSAKGLSIGIDLGTTYSCVGVFQHGKVEIIANDQGNRTTPSYVAFTDTERLIGETKNQVAMNPTNSIFDAKRLIGRKFDDPIVQSDMKLWPFKVISDGGKPKVQVEYKAAQPRPGAAVTRGGDTCGAASDTGTRHGSARELMEKFEWMSLSEDRDQTGAITLCFWNGDARFKLQFMR
ncbi:heat shock 70 kDa protein-like isoform X1 [Eucyclogobius newberryi]|uniref:heat shock 70 kDa protein-like isoform X1 n=1 Tax=Eucyclogobius newberryi TaxID=166745 RepID=UPI003B5B8324